MTCAADPGPPPVPTGQAITPPSQVPAAGVSWTQYDSNSNDLYTEIGANQPGGGSTAQVTYELHNGNSVTLPGTTITLLPARTRHPPTTCHAPPSAPTGCSLNSRTTPGQGDLASSSVPNGYASAAVTTTYLYDADGEQTSVTSPDGNLPGANAGELHHDHYLLR